MEKKEKAEKEKEIGGLKFVLGDEKPSEGEVASRYDDGILWFAKNSDKKSAKVEPVGGESLWTLRSRLRSRVRELGKRGKFGDVKVHVKSKTVNKKVVGVWITKD